MNERGKRGEASWRKPRRQMPVRESGGSDTSDQQLQAIHTKDVGEGESPQQGRLRGLDMSDSLEIRGPILGVPLSIVRMSGSEESKTSISPEHMTRIFRVQQELPVSLENTDIRRIGITDTSRDAVDIQSTEELAKIRARWESITTSPSHHNPNQYCYLVHGLNSKSRKYIELVDSQVRLLPADSFAKSQEGDQSIDLLNHPECVGERVLLNMSLIDQDHHGTYGSGGIIVAVPQENLLISDPSEMGASLATIDLFLEEGKKLDDPEELLKNTDKLGYNEVVACARTNNGEIQLSGFFIKTDASGQYLNPSLALELKNQAKRLGLPLVEVI